MKGKIARHVRSDDLPGVSRELCIFAKMNFDPSFEYWSGEKSLRFQVEIGRANEKLNEFSCAYQIQKLKN